MTTALVTAWLVAAAALAIQPVTDAQEQPSTRVPNSPCGVRIDPVFFDSAEASGGTVTMIAPGEPGNLDAALAVSIDHPQTIFRFAAAEMTPGVREFRVPIDASVDSVVFFLSVQCLQTADITRPSGAPLAAGDGVTVSSFRAIRAAIVKRPETGVWTLRVAGTGMASVMVTARSDLALDAVQFAAAGSTDFTRQPLPGVENAVLILLSGSTTEVKASVVDAAFRRIAPLPLTPHPSGLGYTSRFTPGAVGFRVLVEGKDAGGVPFQRVQAALQTTVR